MAKCSYCETNLSFSAKRYQIGKLTLCLNCMTCTVCGSRATGEPRGLFKNQPFCGQHLGEAQFEMAKPLNEWTDVWLNTRLNFLIQHRQRLAEKLQKALGVSKMEFAAVALSNNPVLTSTGITSSKNFIYQIYKDGIANADTEIASVQEIINKRKAPQAVSGSEESSLQILKVRYAKGEIGKEEYQDMLKILQDPPPPPPP